MGMERRRWRQGGMGGSWWIRDDNWEVSEAYLDRIGGS